MDEGPADAHSDPPDQPSVGLATIARSWGRIGCTGFGGPPAHIAMLRQLCVDQRRWMSAEDFEHGVAATNLLPGPASTQLAILCAWRVRRGAGAVVGGLCFILPGLVVILALAALFLQAHPPRWVDGAAAGTGSAVAAVAVAAGWSLAPAGWRRCGTERAARRRWLLYLVAGGLGAALAGEFLVLVLLGAGALELLLGRPRRPPDTLGALLPGGLLAGVVTGGLGALSWVALKVGALSFGGGFVIVPLMQHDAVHQYHWMTSGQFLTAVALGQVTPGPVLQTVSVVGYAAGGVGAALLASVVTFTPSFAFVLLGAPHFDRLAANRDAGLFLRGAGAAAIGAIFGSAVPLGLAVAHLWQLPVLAAAALWLVALRRAVVVALVGAAAVGVIAALVGLPVTPT